LEYSLYNRSAVHAIQSETYHTMPVAISLLLNRTFCIVQLKLQLRV